MVAYADDEKTGNLVPEGEEIPVSANGRKRQVASYYGCTPELTVLLQTETGELVVLLHTRIGYIYRRRDL